MDAMTRSSGGLTDADMDNAETPDESAQRQAFLKPGGTKAYKNRQQYPDSSGDAAELRAAADSFPGIVETGLRAAHVGLAGPLNAATLGGYGHLERLAGDAGLPGFAQGAEDVRQVHEDHPIGTQFTDAPGYFTGPAAMLSKSIGAGLGAAGRAAPRAVGRVLANRPVAGAVSGGLTGGASSASQAVAEGADAGDVLRATGKGVLIGAAFGAGLGTTAAGADKVINSKGGKARRFVEQHGGKVGVRGTELPGEYVTKGTTDADIGQQAEASAAKGLGMLNTEKKGVLGAVGKRIGRVGGSAEAGTLRDVSDVVANMEASIHDLDTAPQTRAALRDMIDAVKHHQGEGFNPEVDNYYLTEADLNKLRRGLDRHARTGVSTDERLNPLREAANATRSMVGEGPYAEPNAQYAAESKNYQQSRRLLGINERPKTPDETQAAVGKVKNLITRRGQNTVTAGGQEGRLAEFEAKHPEIADEFIKPELLRKKADLSFRLTPKHGGLIERSGELPTRYALAFEAVKHPIATAIAAGLGNNQPISGRLLYPAASEIANAGVRVRPGLGVPQLRLDRRDRREHRR